MPRKGDVTGSPQGPAANDALAGGFGLGALAANLDDAALNMSLATLNGLEEAARDPGALAGAAAAQDLARQITGQLESLEAVLSEVVPGARR